MLATSGWCPQAPHGGRIACASTSVILRGEVGDYKRNLRWLLYPAAVEGATLGLSMTFKPPSPDDLPYLIITHEGICEVESSLADCFTIHRASPALIARCPSNAQDLCKKCTKKTRAYKHLCTRACMFIFIACMLSLCSCMRACVLHVCMHARCMHMYARK
jgi:hypothetical protein